MELDYVWELRAVPSKHICELIISNAAANEIIDQNKVGWSKLPISVTNLESYINVAIVVINYQIMSDTGRIT